MGSEIPSTQAKYEAGRDENGRFTSGNKLSKGSAAPSLKKLNEIRTLWYACNTNEDISDMIEELKTLIKDCPVWEVKLKALVYYLDRSFGKTQETLNVDVQGNSAPLVQIANLSPAEIALAHKLMGKVTDKPVIEVPAIEPAGQG